MGGERHLQDQKWVRRAALQARNGLGEPLVGPEMGEESCTEGKKWVRRGTLRIGNGWGELPLGPEWGWVGKK